MTAVASAIPEQGRALCREAALIITVIGKVVQARVGGMAALFIPQGIRFGRSLKGLAGGRSLVDGMPPGLRGKLLVETTTVVAHSSIR